ncbi:MAG TPA: MFS transporter [Candidatus Lustribacter sp.]|jgi:DHA2 family multidrug resistance protein-like MFS transporter|nr:MFS transporter [Candidatus Lustribacter sp.]
MINEDELPTEGLPPALRRRAYIALAAATMMSVLDGTIANVALPTIGREMHVTPAISIWVVSGFQLAVTASLFTWSAFGQSRGLARVWRYGITIFTIGSLCCAISHNIMALIAARALQGIGAAAILALTSAILRTVFPRDQLGRALGINAMVIGTSVAAGPTIGGAILAIAPWPWLFLINVPVGIAIVILSRGVLPSIRGHGGALHIPSAITSALGFALIVHGIDGIGRGEARPEIALELVVGGCSFAWFLAHQRRLEKPMFAVNLFSRPLFALASLSGIFCYSASALAVVTLPFFFQVVMGVSPLHSGLLMAAWPVTMGLTANFAGRLSDRYPAAILSTLGAGMLGLGLTLYALLPADASAVQIVLHGMLCGFGFGLFQSPNSREMMATAPREQTASASAIMAATRVGGQTCGAAAVSVVFSAFATTLDVHGAAATAHAHAATSAALGIASIVAFTAAAASSIRFWFPRARFLTSSAGS